VEALQRLDALHLVLVGSFGGALRERTFRAVVDATRRLGVEERVHHLGYVPDEDMPALYSEAAALAMPTFFGPTNVPVLEAWAFGCPVVTSDLRGLREQAEGAAVLVEPRSPEAIAEGIRRVVDDAGLRRQLVDRGRVRLESYTFADYCARVADIVSAAKLWISSSA
jgi:glycosyltransferase involved in cell wall biosynthesis